MNQLALLVSSLLALAGERQWPAGGGSEVNETEWQSYKLEYGKSYGGDNGSSLEAMRRAVYASNKRRLAEFPAADDGEPGFGVKLNHLADWTDSERAILNGFRLPADLQARRKGLVNTPEAQEFLEAIWADESREVPDQMDWRQVAGRVSDVKDQGSCGSCWAFSSTGALEGQEEVRQGRSNHSARGNQLIPLSEQNLVDCVRGAYGCRGGWMSDAFNYVKTEGGIEDEDSYPYEARTRKCRFSKDKAVFADQGSATLPAGDEQRLRETVAKFGPVSVAIDASSLSFQFYSGEGVYYNKRCKSKIHNLDHAVLVVGYGTDQKTGADYWLVKNSWGSWWGDGGYIKMARNRENNCGIATLPTIPIF